jgi:hypothetical protein
MTNSRIATIERLGTLVPEKSIKVEVFYNDGSLRRTHRGYWLTARIYKDEGRGFESTDLFNGGIQVLIESANRYNASRHAALAQAVRNWPVYNETIEKVQSKVVASDVEADIAERDFQQLYGV